MRFAPLFVLACAAAASAAPTYTAADLHTTNAFALADVFNPKVFVASGGKVSVVQKGVWSSLGLPSGAQVTDVADSGEVLVHVPGHGDFVQRPYAGALRTTLAPAGGASASYPEAVSWNGVTAGIAVYGGVRSLVVWDGRPRTFGLAVQNVTAINDDGLVVAQVTNARNPLAAATIKGGKLTVLPSPAGSASLPVDVDYGGTVVGGTLDAKNFNSHAAIWSGGKFRDLGVLAGDKTSLLESINDHGIAVGASWTGSNPAHAVLWDGKTLLNLSNLVKTPGVRLRDAITIIDSGQILAAGTINGKATDFLLTPTTAMTAHALAVSAAVPEPADAAVLGVGVFGLMSRQFRRISADKATPRR